MSGAEYLVTVRPGPVVHVWKNGRELAAVHLDRRAALVLVRSILALI